MTTNKANRINRLSSIAKYPHTYTTLSKIVLNTLGALADTMTAKEIAAVIDLAYAQHHAGEMAAEK